MFGLQVAWALATDLDAIMITHILIEQVFP